MSSDQSNNPLHGVTLEAMLEDLVARRDWTGLAEQIDLACFRNEPSLRSSLSFLRRTPWARAKVERLYLADQRTLEKKRVRNLRRKARRAYKASLEAAAGIAPALEGEGGVAGRDEDTADRDGGPVVRDEAGVDRDQAGEA